MIGRLQTVSSYGRRRFRFLKKTTKGTRRGADRKSKRRRHKSGFVWFLAPAIIMPPQIPSACCRCSCLESWKICMSDIACARRAQDIGFCGMSDTSDIVSNETHMLVFPQDNVSCVRHPTKGIVLGTSDASNVRHAYFPAFQTRASTACRKCVRWQSNCGCHGPNET